VRNRAAAWASYNGMPVVLPERFPAPNTYWVFLTPKPW
jgi:hypothetical protein